MRKLTFILLSFIAYSIVFSAPVDINRAKKIAKNIYFERVNLTQEMKYESINLSLVDIKSYQGVDVYYIFNVNKNDGFVIISADDVAKPRIAYSFEGTFSLDNISPEYAFYMKRFQEEISSAVKNRIKADSETTLEWQSYEFASIKSTEQIQMIEPLVLTNWGQSTPFNDMCPTNSEGTALVGCVAVSMGQIMKFWNYPETGLSSHSYYASGFGTQYADFANTNYIWSNMPNNAAGANFDMAQLLYHCGVAVDMGYGIDGSGSYSFLIDNKLEQYFGYHTDATNIDRSDYNATTWLNTIKAEIDAKRPCEYDGFSAEGGHSWVCDGYSGDDLHMNWGWSGSSNGYFAVDDLTPSGSSTFNTDGAVINIHPPTTAYPEGCTTTAKMITGHQGAFNDGSGNENYGNNQDCSYHIISDCAYYVSLNMDELWLSTGDTLYVYDGNSTSAPLLAAYGEASSISTDLNATTTDGLFLNFVTDGSGTAEGWYASYYTKKCFFTKYLYDESGYVEDGSKTCDYDNSTSCLWWIEPAGAASIQVNFEYFALSDPLDYVKIYKGHSTSSADIIAEYYAGDNPTTLNINDGKMTVRFSSSLDGTVADGWKFSYTSSTVGTANIENQISEINVYPNPFSIDATIEFTVDEISDIEISVKDIVGKTLGTYSNNFGLGVHAVKVSEIANNLTEGVYFVTYKSNDIEKTIKVMVSK